MTAILRAFYASLLWATQFELAIALAAPTRNQTYIAELQADEDDYSKALLRLELGL